MGRDAHVLLFALGIGKTQVDKFDVIFFNEVQYILDGHSAAPLKQCEV